MPSITELIAKIKNPNLKSAIEALDGDDRELFEKQLVFEAEASAARHALDEQKEEVARLQALASNWDRFYGFKGAETAEQRLALEEDYGNRYREFPKLQQDLAAAKKALEEKQEAAAAAAVKVEENKGEKKVAETPAIDTSKFLQMTPEDLAALLKKNSDETLQRTLNIVHTASIPATMRVNELTRKAKEDIGLDLDVNLLAETTKKLGNIDLAYQYMTRDLYEKKKQTDFEAKAKEREEAAHARGLAEGQRRAFSPEEATGDYQGNIAAMFRQDGNKNNSVPEVPKDYQFDGSILAKEAAKEWRELEASGKLPM